MRDDYEDRPRSRRPRPMPARYPNLPIWLAGGISVGLLLVFGCCGGLFLIGKRAERDRPNVPAVAIKWGEAATIGPLRVKLKSAALSHYSGDSPAKVVHTSDSVGIVVVVLIETNDKTKEHSAKGAVDSARLTDSLSNAIPRMALKTEFGFTCHIHGQLRGEASYAVRSDDPLTDKLVFDKPVEAATILSLRLDARNYGGTGDILFDIPAEVWKPPGEPAVKGKKR